MATLSLGRMEEQAIAQFWAKAQKPLTAEQRGAVSGIFGSSIGGLTDATTTETTTLQGNEESLSAEMPLRNKAVYGYSDYNMMFDFPRINDRVSIREADLERGRFQEPLDELRIKVAKWLYN